MIEYTVRVFDDGNRHWFLNGRLHREDGPAIEWSDGSKFWYLDGKLVTEQEVMKSSCSGKIVEIDGKKYKLEEYKDENE